MSHWVGLFARLIVSGVLIWAGAAKITRLEESVTAVRGYQLLTPEWAEIVGYGLPVLELILGILLLIGMLIRLNAAIAGGLFAVFIGGIISVWVRGIAINCGCFGDGGANPNAFAEYPWEIARDVGLLALSLYLVWKPKSKFSLDGVIGNGN